MYVDNYNKEQVLEIANTIIEENKKYYNRAINFINKAADIAPSMGLIGTLIGLIQMLSNLDDPTNIGPAMSVALLTTLYGAFIAFAICKPLSAKLYSIKDYYSKLDEIYIETVKSIGNKENPRHLESILNEMVSTKDRVNYFG